MATARRAGRPPAGQSAEHRAAVAAAAREELLERGYAGTTMANIARRAGASKETLYRWYDGKAGLMASLVEEEGRGASEAVERAFSDPALPVEQVLTEFGSRLLLLLTSPWSITANRAAITSPELAETVVAHGRLQVGPVVERYLAEQHRRGRLRVPDAAAAFTELYGLVVRDTQILVLLGQAAPSRQQLRAQAQDGVAAFLRLHAPGA